MGLYENLVKKNNNTMNMQAPTPQMGDFGFKPTQPNMQRRMDFGTPDTENMFSPDQMNPMGAQDLGGMVNLKQFQPEGSGFLDMFSNIGKGVSNWWGGLDSGGKIGAVKDGASALANLWNSYNQGKYADKAAKLQDRAQSFYEQQLNRQNQRQDQAQANYEASFR